MLLELKKFPDPVLLKKVEDVHSFDFVDSIAHVFIDSMERFGGIGLAANQVGINQRFFAIKVDGIEGAEGLQEVAKYRGSIIVCNPKIIEDDGQIQHIEEGCLSLPMIRYALNRKNKIFLHWQDSKGVSHEHYFYGLASVCIQHEMDHLRGVLMLDHLSKLKRQRAEAKILKKASN